MAAVLKAEGVSKHYYLQRDRAQTIKEMVVRRLTGRASAARTHMALRDVSFEVEEGQALGIIGHNGAGKSTLLRLLCGLGRPTSGRIQRVGHVSALLDLGSGFHGDMTGRENIMTGGLLAGLTRRQVLSVEDEIIAFAELEEYIDQPVRTYSSGMYLRLAFATAMQFEPTVLVIDEVLAVGDTRFQQKCLDRLAAFRAAGKTLILTSHVAEQIRSLCDEVLVLEEGRVVMQGQPDDALRCYNDLMRARTERRAAEIGQTAGGAQVGLADGRRQGTQEATITAVHLFDGAGEAVESIASGESLTIELRYARSHAVGDMIVGLGLYNEAHVKCFEVTLPSARETFGELAEQGSLSCQLPELPLLPGRYYVNVGLYPPDWSYVYDYHWQLHSLFITGGDGAGDEISGVLALRPSWFVSAYS